VVAQALRYAQFGWYAPRAGIYGAACNGTTLTIPFSQAALSPVGALTAAQWAVTADGVSKTVSAAAVTNAALVTLTIAAVTNGQAVRVSYTKGGAAPLKDAAGNLTPSFSTDVKNNTP
jgi:uncharacterized repeat protein (TIGR02059 family)